MNLYQTIAESNPKYATNVMSKYGYSAQGVKTRNDLAKVLEQLVAKEGEPALRDIIEGHPHKALFEEIYAQPKNDFVNFSGSGEKKCTCKCGGCHADKDYHNFTGADQLPAHMASISQGTALMAAALILAVAIIVRKN